MPFADLVACRKRGQACREPTDAEYPAFDREKHFARILV